MWHWLCQCTRTSRGPGKALEQARPHWQRQCHPTPFQAVPKCESILFGMGTQARLTRLPAVESESQLAAVFGGKPWHD